MNRYYKLGGAPVPCVSYCVITVGVQKGCLLVWLGVLPVMQQGGPVHVRTGKGFGVGWARALRVNLSSLF